MDYPQYRPGETLGAPGPQPGGPVQSPQLGPPPGGAAYGAPGGYPPQQGPGGVVQGPWPGAAPGSGAGGYPGPQPGPQPGWPGGNPQGGFSGPVGRSPIPPSGGPGAAQRPMAGPPGGGGQPFGQGGGLAKPKRVFGLITPECTLSYPALFQPRLARGAQKAKYQAALIFDPGTDLSELLQAVQAAAADRWGPDGVRALQTGQLKWPIRRGEEKGLPPGTLFINARSDYQPGCVSRYRGPDGRPAIITDPGQLYPGARVRADINAYPFDNSGNRGVTWGLNGIQKMGDGPRLDNRRNAQDQFEALDDAPADFGGQWGAPQHQPQGQWGPPQQPQGSLQWGPPPQQQWQQPQQPQQGQWGQGPALGPGAPWQ